MGKNMRILQYLLLISWVSLANCVSITTPCPEVCEFGQSNCQNKSILICGEDQTTGCISWGVLPCAEGKTCEVRDGKAGCYKQDICDQHHHHKACVGQDVYWFDNCDQQREKVESCPVDTTCQAGECKQTPCQDQCHQDAKQCSGNAVLTCERDAASGCLVWSKPQACTSGEVCDKGVCSSQCPTPCTEDAKQCSGNAVQTCERDAASGCLIWSKPQACAAGEICDKGVCSSQCPTPCTEGAKQCSGNAVQTCERDATSGCLVWKTTEQCKTEQSCEQGACKTTCKDVCTDGAKQCSGNAVQTCGRDAASGCLVWKTTEQCKAEQICEQGACKTTCKDVCTEGAKQCSGNAVQTCERDAQGCLRWGSSTACPSDKVCNQGACVTPTDPSQRTAQMVCARWKSDYPLTTQPNWTSQGNCDPGTIAQGSLDDAIRRVNLYRWFLGLPPVTENKTYSQNAQSCAVLQANNDGPGGSVNAHNPPSTWNCFTQIGASTSGSSNLSWGVSHPADTVPQYIADHNTPSLGHRLWIFAPILGQTGFGLAQGSGRWKVASCMYVFDSSGRGPNPVFLAFPSAGPFPIEAVNLSSYQVRTWSFTSSKHQTSAVQQVTLTRTSDNDVQKLPVTRVGSYSFPSGVSWTPRTPKAGETYKVDIGEVISYTVEFVSCP